MRYLFVILIFFSLVGEATASELYYVCGPNEDGCNAFNRPYCLCMPYDGVQASTSYCLDFNDVSCAPLAHKPNCPSSDVFKDQANCLAVAFQSMPTPPCKLRPKSFCLKNKMSMCGKDGGQDTCMKE
jgi:hypothetical protein